MRRRWLVLLVALATACALACGAFGQDDTSADGDAGGAEAASDTTVTDTTVTADAATRCVVALPSDAQPDTNCLNDGTSVDLQQSTPHCGRCGHSCLGKTRCVNGLCESENLHPDGGNNALGDVSADHAYYMSGPDVQRVGLDGGGAVGVVARATVDGARMTSFVREGDRLYTTVNVGINSVEIGVVDSIASGDSGIRGLLSTTGDGIIADSSNLYFVDYANLNEVNKNGGGSPMSIQTNQEQVFTIIGPTTRDDVLYWIVVQLTALDGGPLTQRLFARTTAGTTTVRAENLGSPMGLAVDDAHLYWVDTATNSVMRVARTGTSVPTVVANWSSTDHLIKALLLDGDDVYWAATADLQAGTDVTIYRAPKCASDATASVIVAAHPHGEFYVGLLADGTYLYYSGLGGVWRVAK